MAVATDSTTAPTRRLLRAAGPCRVLSTDEALALVGDLASPPQRAGHVSLAPPVVPIRPPLPVLSPPFVTARA